MNGNFNLKNILKTQPFKCQPHKMAKHTQTIDGVTTDELFEYV